jgi:hypothetical protein
VCDDSSARRAVAVARTAVSRVRAPAAAKRKPLGCHAATLLFRSLDPELALEALASTLRCCASAGRRPPPTTRNSHSTHSTAHSSSHTARAPAPAGAGHGRRTAPRKAPPNLATRSPPGTARHKHKHKAAARKQAPPPNTPNQNGARATMRARNAQFEARASLQLYLSARFTLYYCTRGK